MKLKVRHTSFTASIAGESLHTAVGELFFFLFSFFSLLFVQRRGGHDTASQLHFNSFVLPQVPNPVSVRIRLVPAAGRGSGLTLEL